MRAAPILPAGGAPGASGPPGLSLTWRGAWAGGTAYAVDDVVARGGQSYVAISAQSGFDPLTDAGVHWGLMSQKGDTGAAGATGATGAVGLTWTGTWSTLTAYAVRDAVTRLGASYVAVAPNTAVDPSTDGGSNWQVLAAKGDAGATGAAGAAGAPGLLWQGAWSAATAYAVNDAVSYNGSSYRCILARSATATTPDADATHWAVLASKGDAGAGGTVPPSGFAQNEITWKVFATGTAYNVLDGTIGPQGPVVCISAGALGSTTNDPTKWVTLRASDTKVVSETIAALATYTGTISNASAQQESLGKTALVTRLRSSHPVRVRCYSTVAKRDADASRPVGTDPTGDHGLLLEVVTDATHLAYDLSPAVLLTNLEAVRVRSIPVIVQSLDAVNPNVVVYFDWIVLEV